VYKRQLVNLLTGAAVLAAYCIYAFGRHAAQLASGDLKFWATTILIFVGIGVVALIIIQIVFHILTSIGMAISVKVRDQQASDKEIEATIERSIGSEMVEDEMDRLIELKANRIGFAAAGIGFIAGLVALLLGYSAVIMLNILFLAFSGGSLLEGMAQLYFYRRGVAHA
jgi:hypothetical protein